MRISPNDVRQAREISVMLIRNCFSVAGTPDDVFAELVNIDAIASCIPGAALEAPDGSVLRRGAIDIRLGMMRFQYKGEFSITVMDQTARRAVIDGQGMDTTGEGGVTAHVVMTVTEAAAGSEVLIETDVKLAGPVAQLGRGLIEEFAQEIVDQFATNLSTRRLQSAGVNDSVALGVIASRQQAPDELNGAVLLLRILWRRIKAVFGVRR